MVLVVVLAVTTQLPGQEMKSFLFAALVGLITFTGVEVLGQVLDRETQAESVTRVGGGLGLSYILKCWTLVFHSMV